MNMTINEYKYIYTDVEVRALPAEENQKPKSRVHEDAKHLCIYSYIRYILFQTITSLTIITIITKFTVLHCFLPNSPLIGQKVLIYFQLRVYIIALVLILYRNNLHGDLCFICSTDNAGT